MTFSCVSFCRNILALWSVPLYLFLSEPGIEHTPNWTFIIFGNLCENDPMSGESRSALGDADTREWHFFHQRFSSAQRKPLCSSERISITRCRMGELNEAGCYRVYLGSMPCSQSVPEKVSARCQCSPFCRTLERRSKGGKKKRPSWKSAGS